MYDFSEFPNQPHEPELWKHPIFWVGLCALGLWILSESESETSNQACSVCGVPGHNSASCPHNGVRVNFSRSIPKSRRCECCGRRTKAHRHHTRGRSDDSDFLDVCTDCHLTCCHDGDFNNIGVKPRVCRVMNRKSSWIL
jgi:hypothetical protein